METLKRMSNAIRVLAAEGVQKANSGHPGMPMGIADVATILFSQHLNIDVKEFLMIGNSLKSDVLPILNIGAKAVHVPFHTTWAHEMVEEDELVNNHLKLNSLKDILKYLIINEDSK